LLAAPASQSRSDAHWLCLVMADDTGSYYFC
jgi:hypothetical protein